MQIDKGVIIFTSNHVKQRNLAVFGGSNQKSRPVRHFEFRVINQETNHLGSFFDTLALLSSLKTSCLIT